MTDLGAGSGAADQAQIFVLPAFRFAAAAQEQSGPRSPQADVDAYTVGSFSGNIYDACR